MRLTVLIGAAVLTVASGCTWQQTYSAAQGWQRNQCNRLPEQAERERCLSNNNISYDDYRRQTEGIEEGLGRGYRRGNHVRVTTGNMYTVK